MTSEQSEEIRKTVDRGGWNAVRSDKRLSAIWQQHLKDSRRHVNEVVDVD
jgi:hypothetical protein